MDYKKRDYRTPRPPGFGRGWKKEGKHWVNLKTGERWRFHPEDEVHYPHWDVEIPSRGKIRIPIDTKKDVFKDQK